MMANRKTFYTSLILIVLMVGALYFYRNYLDGGADIGARSINIENNSAKESAKYPASPLNGVSCQNYNRRAFGVMIAEDYEARPLSGIGLADIVIEMPVVTGSITRMLALFGCNEVEEIGSVRSARHDFISIAKGYDAILAHWGGSALALEKLKEGTLDNLDALPNYFDAFYRKNDIGPPHNGFTDTRRMINAARNLGYRIESEFAGYRFEAQNSNFKTQNPAGNLEVLEINYKKPYNIKYEYNDERGVYSRWRGGEKEIDKLTGKQVEAKNVVVMRAVSRQIGGGYNDINISGSGEAVVYNGGEETGGEWVKESDEGVLRFYSGNQEEIAFIPGSIWIEVVEPTTEIVYK